MTEEKQKQTRQNLTWWVCGVNADGLIDPDYATSYASLRECEDACKARAIASVGKIYRPIKLGDIIVAQMKTTIELA